jgi:hypothetical protein
MGGQGPYVLGSHFPLDSRVHIGDVIQVSVGVYLRSCQVSIDVSHSYITSCGGVPSLSGSRIHRSPASSPGLSWEAATERVVHYGRLSPKAPRPWRVVIMAMRGSPEDR